ncbi:hypothetical protein BGZ76_009807 [Entomortierella beljakovae]|nr:hypothetical protein BGZ76_009807 [Entomortierella beljakovae]
MDNFDSPINGSGGNSLQNNEPINVLMPNDTDPIDDAFQNEDHHYRRASYSNQGDNQEGRRDDSRDRETNSRRDSRGRSSSPGSTSRRQDRDDKYNSDPRHSSAHENDRGGRGKPRSRSPSGRSSNATSTLRDRRVYVGNLSYDVKWTDLKDFMRDVGPVAHADVLLNSDGRSKGCGVVEFNNAEDAKEAIRRLNDVVLMGRPVFVREDRESDVRIGFSGGRGNGLPSRGGESSGTRQIYVANLPYSVNWKDLKDMFRRAGPVDRADVFMTNEGRSKGSGTVSFERSSDVSRAVSMFNGFEWHGRRIEVREDKFGPPAGGSSRGPSRHESSRHESSRHESSRHDSRHEPSRGGYSDSYGYGSGGHNSYRHDNSRQHDLYDGSARSHHSSAYNDMSMDSVPSGPAAGSGDQIYIRNLPLTTTEQDLRDLFRTCGHIRLAEIILSNGRPKGSGIVRFEMFEAADKAVAKFNGYIYGGRPLEIVYDRA